MSVLIGIFAAGVAFAGRPEAIDKLVDAGKADAAVARCVRWEPEDARLVRACGVARLQAAQSEAAQWAVAQEFAGTPLGDEALDRAAATRLDELVKTPDPEGIELFFERYAGTDAEKSALSVLRDPLLKSVHEPAGAKLALALYPSDPRVQPLLASYLDHLVQVRMVGSQLHASFEGDTELVGRGMSARWVGRTVDGRVLAWDAAVRLHAREQAVPVGFLEAYKMPSEPYFTVCKPGAYSAALAVEVSMDMARAVVSAPESVQACGAGRPPVLLVVSAAAMRAMSVRPGHLWTFATALDVGSFSWGLGERQATLMLGGPAGELQLGAEGPAQRVGEGWMLHPRDGSLPVHVSGPMPSGAQLGNAPAGVKGVPMPSASAGAGGGQVAKLESWEWALPSGELRVFSPLLAEVARLDAEHPDVRAGWPVVSDVRAVVVDGRGRAKRVADHAAVALRPLDYVGVAQVSGELRQAGLPVRVVRGWRVPEVGPQSPLVIFEGKAGEQLVRGARWVDAMGRWRAVAYAVEAHGAAAFAWTEGAETRFGFVQDDVGGGAWSELMALRNESLWRERRLLTAAL